MLKYAAIFLILSLIAGSMGFITVSRVARRISLVLFGVFLAMALLVVGFFVLLDKAIDTGALPATLAMFS